ncbi:MAG: hypothetical protein JOZ41_19285 [Chloroflexi bacterium]|nr:hypothetical protein [Chloroflexota bacterium]
MMYLRVARGAYRTGSKDELQRAMLGQLVPALKRQPGFQTYIGGLDRAAEEAIEVSLWEGKDGAGTTTAQPAQLASLVQFEPAELYRIVIFPAGFPYPSTGGGATTYARLARGSYDVANQDQLAKFVGQDLLPAIHDFPGTLGMVGGVQQRAGKLVVLSLWETRETALALEATRARYGIMVRFEPAAIYEIVAQA